MGAITHVDEIIGLDKRIKKVAGEGGGGANTEIIAPDYDETKNPADKYAYRIGDYVIFNDELYKAKTNIMTKAGAFNPEMWDQVPAYNSEETYSEGDYVAYMGDLYKCTGETTGEWDSSKWALQYPQSYSPSNSYYSVGSVVENDGSYYEANSDFENAPVGPFDLTKWDETFITANLTATIKDYHYVMQATQESRGQVMIPVMGETPRNILRVELTMVNPDGDNCVCDCNFAIGGGFAGSAGTCTMVMPYSTGIKIIDLDVSTVMAAGNYIVITVKRFTEIALSGGDLALTTATEMYFPPTGVAIYTISDNVKRQHIS